MRLRPGARIRDFYQDGEDKVIFRKKLSGIAWQIA
jgi:hypothetical protein